MSAPLVHDRYQIVRRVGKGGMSRVYLAWDQRLRVYCALKVMAREVVGDEVMRSRFAQEARVMARLSHPHLLRLFDLREDVETPFMAMEFLEGGTVGRRLTRGPLHVHQALTIATHLCSALSAAHGAGVVHRDVKPQNLLLDRKGHMKLADFGVARTMGDLRLTMSNMSLGTLAYMPPEQQRDASKVDPRADVYGAGATLYAMVTARRPTPLVATERDRAIAALPEVLQDVIAKATEAERAHRYASADEMLAALERVLAGVSRPDLEATSLVVAPSLLPSRAPREEDLDEDIGPDELSGTSRPWTPVGSSAPPSMVKTMLLDEPTAAPRPGSAAPVFDEPAPEPASRRRWPLAVALLLVLGAALVCAGLCAGGLLGGLGAGLL